MLRSLVGSEMCIRDRHTTLLELKEDPIPKPLIIELLDPNGHSQILHEDAVLEEITDDVLATLPVGPEPAVFENKESD